MYVTIRGQAMVYNRGRAKINSSHLPLAYITSLSLIPGCAKTLPMFDPVNRIENLDASPSVFKADYNPINQDEACEAVGFALLKGIRDNHKQGYREGDLVLNGDRKVTFIYTTPLNSCDTFLDYVLSLNAQLKKILEKEIANDPISPYSFEANPEILNLVGNQGNERLQHIAACRLEGICLGRSVDHVITPLDELAQYIYILNNLSVTNESGNILIAAPREKLNEVVQRRWKP